MSDHLLKEMTIRFDGNGMSLRGSFTCWRVLRLVPAATPTPRLSELPSVGSNVSSRKWSVLLLIMTRG